MHRPRCRAFRRGSLVLLLLAGCAANLPPTRPPVYGGPIEPIPAAAAVVIGDGTPVRATFATTNSIRVFERGGTRPVVTIELALAGDRRIVERPGGYGLQATITDAGLASDPRMDAASERNMANQAAALRGVELHMQLDRDRRPLAETLRLTQSPSAADGRGGIGELPDTVRELLGRLMEQRPLAAGQRLATGDRPVSVTQALPDGRSFTVHEVVEGRVIHDGRPAVLLRTDADLPPGMPLAVSGYSVVDQATGTPLLWQASLAKIERGVGSESLVTTRYTIEDGD